ncbi:MAG: MMPL family transporter [Planctomycetes bacterium]|nr:MMPL family transporter [Planctomycetota bacterium]
MSVLRSPQGALERALVLSLRYPRASVFGVCALTVAFACCIPWLQRDVRMEKIFPDEHPLRAIHDAFRATFGSDDTTAFCVVELPYDVLSQRGIRRVHALTEQLAQLRCVDPERLTSLSSAPLAKVRGVDVEVSPVYTPEEDATWNPEAQWALLRTNPAVMNRLLSEDRRLAGFWIPLAPGDESESARREFGLTLLEFFSPEGALAAGETGYLEGFAVSNVRVLKLMDSDLRAFFPLAFALIFLALGAVFRRLVPTLLALVTVGLSTVWTLGFMGLTGFPLSFLSTVIPVMVLVVCVGDAIYLLTRFRQELADRLPAAAMRAAVEEVGRACLFTSLTTACGFASLATSRAEIVRELGIPVAFGVLAAYLTTFALLPPLVLWLSPTALAQAARKGPRKVNPLGWVARAIRRRPLVVVVASTLLVLGDLALLPPSRETRMLNDFDEDDPLVVTRDFFEERMGGAVPLELVIDAGERAFDPAVQRGLLALGEELRGPALRGEGVLYALSLADFLSDAYLTMNERDPAVAGTLPDSPEALAELHFLYWFSGEDPTEAYVDSVDDPRQLRLQMRIENLYTTRFYALLERVDAAAQRHLPEGVSWKLTGASVMNQVIQSTLTEEMTRTVGTAFVLVFLLIVVFFRSPTLAALAILPNLLPLLLLGGLMVVSGTALSLSTSVLFAIVFGISVDDTIHVVAGLQHRDGLNDPEGIVQTLEETGVALLLSSVVLVLGFSVLLASEFPANRLFGAMVSAAIGFALAGDLLLLPALLFLKVERGRAGGSPAEPAQASTPG